MNDRERRRILEDSRHRIDELLAAFDRLLGRIHDSESAGYRSPRFDPSSPGPATVLHCFEHGKDNCDCGQNTTIAVASDRTGDAATSSADVASDTLRRLDLHLASVAKATVELDAIKAGYILTSEQEDRLKHPDADDPDMPVCEVVARVKDKRGKSRQLEPLHRFSDVGGRLPVKMRLGKWAYDYVLAVGVLPSMEQIEAHIDGRHVRRKAS